MHAHIALDRTLVAVHLDGVVHLMLELTAPPAVESARKPIDVMLVLDRSGSMSGAPLDAVREATCGLLRHLGPDDRLGLVVFDDEAQLVLPLMHHDADRAISRVRSIEADGSTNVSGGWLKAIETMSTDVRSDAVRRIVVLTDGHANVGITDPTSLCGLLQGARSQGVTTSTIGFDDGFDETFLATLADAGAGNGYWCAGPDQTAAVFAAEFEGLASVVAQNISVEIRPPDGMSIAVLHEYPMVEVGGGIQVALGDAYGGERRRVVVAYDLGTPTATGPVGLGDLVVRWASTIGDVALHTTTIPVEVQCTDDPTAADSGVDPQVTEQVNVLRAARSRKTAHDRLAHGDRDAARAALVDAVSMLELLGDEAELRRAKEDLAQLERGAWRAMDTKRLYSTQREMQRGRKSRFEDED